MARKNTAKEIIQQAGKLFRNRGYHATSMNDIAHSVGLKKASLYNHFPSKEDIARAVVKSVGSEFQLNVIDVAENSALSPAQRLRQISDYLYRHFSENRGCIIASLSMGEADDKELPTTEITQLLENWQGALVTLLSTRFDAEKSKQLVYALIQDLLGGQVMMRLHFERQDLIRKACDDFANLLSE